MTAYATEADLIAFAVGLVLPGSETVQGALVQGNHWVTRQIERAEVTFSSSALIDARYAACAYALSVLSGNGLITTAEQSAESLKLGPLEFKLSKAQSVALPNFLAQATAYLDDLGVTAAQGDTVEIVTSFRRRW